MHKRHKMTSSIVLLCQKNKLTLLTRAQKRINIQQRKCAVRLTPRLQCFHFLEYISNWDRSEIERECPAQSCNSRENEQCSQTSHLSFIELTSEIGNCLTWEMVEPIAPNIGIGQLQAFQMPKVYKSTILSANFSNEACHKSMSQKYNKKDIHEIPG